MNGCIGLKDLPARLSIAGWTARTRRGRFAPHANGSTVTERRPDLGAFSQLLGYRILEWGPGRCRLEADITPTLLNRSGIVHGGVLAAIIDSAGGHAGTWCAVEGNVRRCVTVSLTVSYAGQARSGKLIADGRVRGGGRSIYFASTEIRDGRGALLAFGDATYKYRRGSDRPEGVPAE